jgi:MYXO-CTERM domain-containing protein
MEPNTTSSSSGGQNPSETGGCGCGFTGAPEVGGFWVGLGLLLAARRRRRGGVAAR